MRLIIGLGNPGFRYRSTRHNIGFMVLESIARTSGIRVRKPGYNSLRGWGSIADEKAILAKPLTYMNLSGKAVSNIKEKEGIALQDLLIIMDDADLPLGKIRIRPNGSSGGHKGLRSIIEELGTEEVTRLRVGIAPQKRAGDLADYVLSPFKRSERKLLDQAIKTCCLCVEAWARDGINAAMNRFNP